MIAPPRAAAPFVRPPFQRALAAAFALLLGATAPHVARASTEQFSTFDVERPEEDDESLLDHALTEAPRTWDDAWRRSVNGIRSEQGCLTSGQWLTETLLRAGTQMGKRARFDAQVLQSESDYASYGYMDFLFRFPQGFGTPGAMFRPFFDKSRQDFAITYEAGSDTGSAFLAAAFTFEDMFNNLWAWRQTRVGNASEAYERHPYEPALRAGVDRTSWRASIGGKYLTPSTKRTQDDPSVHHVERHTLWGTLGDARLEVDLLGLTFEATGMNEQASSTRTVIPNPDYGGGFTPTDSALFAAGDDASFRRLWNAGASVRRPLRRWTVEARWLYQARTQTWAPPTGSGRFEALDRLLGLELSRAFNSTLRARVGGLYDQIGVVHAGSTPGRGYGSRKESRAYIGLDARFGNVRVFGVEGIELDHEPYPVWFVHDKGFLGLQATF